MTRTYLDHNATTATAQHVIDAMTAAATPPFGLPFKRDANICLFRVWTILRR